MKKTITRDVHGLVFKNVSTKPTVRNSIIIMRVTKDERGASLSLADTEITLMIPLEVVQDVIKLTGDIAQ